MIDKFFGLTSLQSLFRRSQFLIFAITFLICTLIFASISIFTVKSYANQNLTLVSRTIAERIQPALVFQDKYTLDNILHEYTQQHSIRLIQVLDSNKVKITESSKLIDRHSELQTWFDGLFFSKPIQIDITHNGQLVGELHLFGSSQDIILFIIKICLALILGMLFMIFALWWSVNATYRHIMNSISPIIHTAQLVSQQKAYNLRFPKNDIQEFHHLNSVFNQLLEEIQSWHNQLQSENTQLNYQVQHDELTHLPNRHYFYKVLCNLFDQPDKRENTVLIFIDNNKFKSINDQYGHLVGDEVLKEMANRLKQNTRQNDFVARLSGDEFAIILSPVSQVDHLISIAENLIKCSDEPLKYNGQSIHFSFSLGIALAKEAHNPEDLISQADQAMYKAKNLKHHWHIFQQ
ncbi:sensor domain-containing diguanylate cyclase [Acinetobacter sp. YH12239]|uniref:sensor domain-containing diguanylate cyclase n=1 Tax=Acinetobacter sp. YH12239 TaxID=2601166 RepID=UPI0015D2D314|nr:sensor domain-containing diguanylate cyclase [Acinetobacter sp. YH12239]